MDVVVALWVLVTAGVIAVYLVADTVFQNHQRKKRRINTLSTLGQRIICAHVYDEVPDNEQEDPQSSMTVAVANLYTYDVRCRHCGHRTRLSQPDYAQNLRDTRRMV